MNRDETIEMLAVLKAAYPHSFKGMTKNDANAMLNLWARIFAGDDKRVIAAAIDSLIATRTVGYSPTPGEVKEEARKILARDELDELSAWALVSKACANGIYGYKEEFAKLPPEVQAAVGAPENLREWGMMDVDTVQSVVASNFQRNYRATMTRKKEQDKLPLSVQNMIAGVAGKLSLPGSEVSP